MSELSGSIRIGSLDPDSLIECTTRLTYLSWLYCVNMKDNHGMHGWCIATIDGCTVMTQCDTLNSLFVKTNGLCLTRAEKAIDIENHDAVLIW